MNSPGNQRRSLNYARAICLAVIRDGKLPRDMYSKQRRHPLLFQPRLPLPRDPKIPVIARQKRFLYFPNFQQPPPLDRGFILLLVHGIKVCSSWKNSTKHDSYFNNDPSLLSVSFIY